MLILSISSEYYSANERHTEKEAEEQRRNFQAALDLLKYYRDMPLLLDCLRKYDLCRNARELMEQVLQSLSDTSKVSLSEGRGQLENIRKLISELEPQQLAYFKMVVKAEELISFLLPYSEREFNETINFLNGELQGDEFGLNVINSLITARKLLEPFIALLVASKGQGSRGNMELSALCSNIKHAIAGLDIMAKVDEVEKLQQHLPVIRVWFSSTDDLTLERILPYIVHLLNAGYFVSRLALHSQGEELYLCYKEGTKTAQKGTEKLSDTKAQGAKEERKLPPTHLQDIIRRANIFVNKATIDEKGARALQYFVAVFQEAQQVHSLRLQLEKTGHMDFQVRV